MKLRRILALLVLGALICTITYLILDGPKKDGAASGLQVVVAENFYGDIAKQIGGSHVQVTSIISDPEADPHLYESSAKNAAAISRADVVITNGLGYDDFMDKLLSTTQNPERHVLQAAEVFGLKNKNANPHLWYNIKEINKLAERIARDYAQADPAHKTDYQKNLAAFKASLQPLLTSIDTIKQKYAGTPVVYTEPVVGYVIEAAGLKPVTPAGFARSIEAGSDPSPADNLAMQDLLATKTAKIMFYNSQATSPITEQARKIAQQNGVAVIGITETLPAGQKSYQSWQQSQLDQIKRALETK